MKGLIFTWLLTFLGVTGSVFNPYYGFLAYVALALVKPDAMWRHAIHNGRFSLIVALAMLASWMFRGCGNWNLGKARPIVFSFVGFWMWTVLLAYIAESPPHAWTFVESMAKILLPFLVGITTCRSIRDLKALAWVIVVCEGYVCFEMNLRYFGGYNYLYFVGFAGMDNNSVAIGFVTAIGVAFFLFLNTESMVQKAIIGACMAFMLHAILFSFSRGAMLATVIGVTISFFLIKKNLMHYSLFGLLLVAGIMLAGPQVRERFAATFASDNGKREASAQSRLDLWKDCWTLFKRDPILGCGPDHWPLHAEEFGWPKNKEAHSLWVQMATETGIPGIVMYLGFYALCILRCCGLLMKIPARAPPWFGDSCRMTIAALIGFGVAAQFVSLELLEVPYYVALLGAASLMIYGRHLEEGLIDFSDDDDEPTADWRDRMETTAVYNDSDMLIREPVQIFN
ncbi:MAG: O-antigen ligase family protein [Planctomycetaceae bacterium]